MLNKLPLKIEGTKSNRPLTHELFKILTDYYKIKIKEVYIYSVLEGLFYTKIITTNDNNEEVSIDCSTGDGVSTFHSLWMSIICFKRSTRYTGVYINDDGTTSNEDEDDISYYDYESDDKV